MPIDIYQNHPNNNHFDSQLKNMVKAEVQDDHYFSSCLSVRAPYFGALSDLPLLIFTPRKMHSGHHHINRLLSRIRQNGLKIKMLQHLAHHAQWERERALEECIGIVWNSVMGPSRIIFSLHSLFC